METHAACIQGVRSAILQTARQVGKEYGVELVPNGLLEVLI